MYFLKAELLRNGRNMIGWSTDRKILVIESDDWGAIRMPSSQVYEDLLAKNIPVNRSYFNRNDSLESNNDLDALFEVLTKYRDVNGAHPVITALCVVANPNFERIRRNGFENFEYEIVSDTFTRYGNSRNRVLDLWREGIRC